MKARGFTLLEVLIALSIFTLIGLGTGQVLKTVIDTRELTEDYSTRYSELQRALAMLDRDLVQMTDRGIRDELGDPRPAMVVGDEPYVIEFTRLGWRNPARVKRSEVQRVAYSLVDGVLQRHYWLVLDRAEDSEPVTQRLLTDVEDFRIDAITGDGTSSFLWPPIDEEGEPGGGLPERLQVTIALEEVGEIVRLVNLVAPAKRGSGGGSGGSGGGGDQGKEGVTGG